MRTVFAARCALMLVLMPRPTVRAEPTRDWGMDVYAPESLRCVTADRLRAAIEERVGAKVFLDASHATHRASVRVTARHDHDLSAVIHLTDHRGQSLGERKVHSSGGSCGELARSLVLVISTLIGIEREPPVAPHAPELATSGTATPPQPTAERMPARTSVSPPLQPRGAPERRRLSAASGPLPTKAREPIRLGLSLLAEGQSGLLPGFAPLGSLGVLARYRWLELRLTLSGAPWAARELGGDAHASFGALLGRADFCGIPWAGSIFDLALCTGAQAGAIRAESRGLQENATTVRPVALLTVRASVAMRVLAKHAVLIGFGGALPVLSQNYRFLERGGTQRSIHRVELGLFAEIGWLFRFAS
jgi:hypothetical protein